MKDLRVAFLANQVSITQPKGVEEGSEIRVMWTCAAANVKSVISEVESGKISLTPVSTARKQTIQLSRGKGKILLIPQSKKGDTVEENQIVAAVIPVQTKLTCPPTVSESYFIDKLSSVNLSERYAAAKALRYRGYTTAKPFFEARMNDPEEDIYVQLEAAAALAVENDPKGWEFMEEKLRSSVMTVPLETQLETVIVISEIPKERSERLLIEVLKDAARDDELRAGAAWALGQFASKTSATALVDTFNISTVEIKVEAARALLRIAEPQVSHLVELLADIMSRSLYNFRVLLAFCDDIGFHLAEDFYWFNPAKLPSPIEWVNKRKMRAKDSVNTVWWFSKTPFPKADVCKVLAPYSDRMKKLIEDPESFYKPKKRPSGHDISASFGKDNGGAIPSNLLTIPNTDSNSSYMRMCKELGLERHPARFPSEVPAFFIKMLTDENDVVLDIFGGSNTTGFTAEALNRKWLSFELSQEYLATSVFRFLEGESVETIKKVLNKLDNPHSDLLLQDTICFLLSQKPKKQQSVPREQAALF